MRAAGQGRPHGTDGACGCMNPEKGGVLRRSDAVKHRVSTVTAVSQRVVSGNFCPEVLSGKQAWRQANPRSEHESVSRDRHAGRRVFLVSGSGVSGRRWGDVGGIGVCGRAGRQSVV
ncbi:hypothetical protein PCAR4_630029 [Paraburkholderia caribensis]|nr:hypothetical protein PCAR4_630029 [Paraburkholderia caribensis]